LCDVAEGPTPHAIFDLTDEDNNSSLEQWMQANFPDGDDNSGGMFYFKSSFSYV
jgi:hypothetical protein